MKGMKAHVASLEDKHRQKEAIRQSVLYEENQSLKVALESTRERQRSLEEKYQQGLIEVGILEETRACLVEEKKEREGRMVSLEKLLRESERRQVVEKGKTGEIMNLALQTGDSQVVDLVQQVLTGGSY